MKAWQCTDARPIPGLTAVDVEMPSPGTGEVLIRVVAAGVTPSELQWYPTTHTKSGDERRHAIPGHEFSGVVVATGEDTDIAVGQEVFGMNDWFADGATAEFCCAAGLAVAPKPRGLSYAEAASAPISALTAWQGLFERTDLQPGERVLIHGGAGGVGALAVQLARWCGAYVVATASARHTEFLLKLGADRVIDYRAERFEDFGNTFHVVFDGVGAETLTRSWNVLAPGGRLVTIASQSETDQNEKAKKAFFIVEPNREQLTKLSALFDSGMMRPVVDKILPFDQVPRAYLLEAPSVHGVGKTVIQLGN